MKRLFFTALAICFTLLGKSQTSFTNPTEGVSAPILNLSSGTGSIPGSGGSIVFYKGANLHPMGKIYTSNVISNGVSSIGKLTLSSYYTSYKDEVTLFNGLVGIGTSTPLAKFNVNDGVDRNLLVRSAASVLGIQGIALQSVNNANSTHQPFVIESSTLLLNAGTGGNVGIGITAPNSLYKLVVNGAVGIGTNISLAAMPPRTRDYKLIVDGAIGASEVYVTLTRPWPDYVFNNKYKLVSLLQLEQFIKENKHLPNIPSAMGLEKEGYINLGAMNAKLLEKIEELTLYVIDLQKQLNNLSGK